MRKTENFAQHLIVRGETQTQICLPPPAALPWIRCHFLVTYVNSHRKHTSLDIRGPSIPRAKLSIWPREDGRSFPYSDIVTQSHTIRTHCHLWTTYYVSDTLFAQLHFMPTAALIGNTVTVPILQLRKLRLREKRYLLQGHTLSKQQS